MPRFLSQNKKKRRKEVTELSLHTGIMNRFHCTLEQIADFAMLKSRIYEDNKLKKKMQEGAHKILEQNKTTPFF